MTKILLDIPRLSAKPHGAQVYVQSVVEALLQVAPPEWELILHSLGWRHRPEHLAQLDKLEGRRRGKVIAFPMPERFHNRLVRTIGYSPSLEYGSVDLVHSFGFRFVPKTNCPIIAAIQDIIPVRLKEGADIHGVASESGFKRLIASADVVVTISEFSKSEICELLAVDPGKVKVIANGVNLNHFKPLVQEDSGSLKALLKRLGIVEPYILQIGGPPARKNTTRLIQAYDLLRSKYSARHKLVLAGSDVLADPVMTAIGASSFNSDIVHARYLSRMDALQIIQGADVLAFPSTYEGFGLPPLEAMACGVPVASSNAASLPEVGGDAVVYFDPYNIEEMAQSIYNLVSDTELRATCVARGLERCQKFTWHANAIKTIELYKQLLL